MKIRLVNFKCYKDASFDFGDTGLVLISGPSGSGKTSIFVGIYFALYGYGTDILHEGETSCYVELTFEDIWIKRSKKPNRLVLKQNDTTYEDDEAQSIINAKFSNTFDTCGYISQDATNSFILMNPTDKLEFIEKFAFKDANIAEIKARCKSLIKKTEETLTSAKAKLESSKEVLDNQEKPVKVKFPFRIEEKENLQEEQEKLVKQETVKYNNSIIRLKTKTKQLYTLKDELCDLKVYKTRESSNISTLESLNTKLSGSMKVLNELIEQQEKETLQFSYEELTEYYTSILKEKEYYDLQKKYTENLKVLNTSKEKELETYKKNIKEIDDVLWIEWKEDEINEEIEKYQSIQQDLTLLDKYGEELKQYASIDDVNNKEEELKQLKTKLDVKKEELSKLLLYEKSYTCPVCETVLYVNDDVLEVIEDRVEVDNSNVLRKVIKKISDDISALEKLIPSLKIRKEKYTKILENINKIKQEYEDDITSYDLQDISEELERLVEYKTEQISLQKKKKELQSKISKNIHNDTILSLEDDVEELKNRLERLKQTKSTQKLSLNISETECKEKINVLEKINEEISRTQLGISSLKKEIKTINDKLEKDKTEYLSKRENNEIKQVNDLETEIKDLETEIKDLESKKQKHEENIKKIEKYVAYRKEEDRYNQLKNKYDKYKEEEKIAEDKYSSALTLKEKIMEAESIAMANITSSINTHAQVYLDDFFQDNPIVVKLLPFKETKKATKPQISIEVEYKGMECGLSRLSGGQKSRVILAFTLALSDIFNIPFIMLDECTSSLDQDLNTIVTECLKENFGTKLVLVIAHQSIEGVYDRIIRLN